MRLPAAASSRSRDSSSTHRRDMTSLASRFPSPVGVGACAQLLRGPLPLPVPLTLRTWEVACATAACARASRLVAAGGADAFFRPCRTNEVDGSDHTDDGDRDAERYDSPQGVLLDCRHGRRGRAGARRALSSLRLNFRNRRVPIRRMLVGSSSRISDLSIESASSWTSSPRRTPPCRRAERSWRSSGCGPGCCGANAAPGSGGRPGRRSRVRSAAATASDTAVPAIPSRRGRCRRGDGDSGEHERVPAGPAAEGGARDCDDGERAEAVAGDGEDPRGKRSRCSRDVGDGRAGDG